MNVLGAVLLLAVSACSAQVIVKHELRAPIRCRMDHKKHDLGFVCDHVVQELVSTPPAGSEIPPL